LLLVELRYQKNNVNRDSYLSRFPADASVIEKAIENLGKEANAAGTESLLTTEVKPGPSSSLDIKKLGLPKRFARFEILEKLGSGSFGDVYKAHDVTLKRFVALKISRLENAPEEVRKQFLHEARALVNVQGPGIVNVYDVLEEPFDEFSGQRPPIVIVQQFINGRTIDRRRKEQPNTGDFDRFARFVAAIAEILEAADKAHSRAIGNDGPGPVENGTRWQCQPRPR